MSNGRLFLTILDIRSAGCGFAARRERRRNLSTLAASKRVRVREGRCQPRSHASRSQKHSASLVEASVMKTRSERFSSASGVSARAVAILSVGVYLTGCAAEPSARPVRRQYREAPAPAPVEKPSTDVYAYPLHGQTPEQQDRDRYDCNLWAVKQTGFDPSAPNVPPHARVRVVSAGPPPGTGTAVGAVTGAIIGAAISRPWEAATGALAGAVVGGAIGN